MNRTHLARLSASLLFLLFSWLAYTQNQIQAPQLTINKVKEDLYNIEGDGGNVAVLVSSEGVILVDDKFDRDHDAIVSKIKSVTNQPVRYVLSTHHHSDHSGGNARFLPTAEIISTANRLSSGAANNSHGRSHGPNESSHRLFRRRQPCRVDRDARCGG